MNSIADFIDFLNKYSGLVSAVLAFALFVWPIYNWFKSQREAAAARNYEVYHRLIREIVQPDASGDTWVDRQMAAVYELRKFREYYPVTYRVLQHLKSAWSTKTPPGDKDVLAEIDLTIEHIKDKKRRWVDLDK